MKRPLVLAVLVDALGWELAESTGFLRAHAPHRKPLRTVLGFSSSAVPTLLTGVTPDRHGHWFLFRKAGRRTFSPEARAFRLLPRRVRRSWRLRRLATDWFRARNRIRGYFSLYDVPWETLARLEYTEKKDTWRPGGIEGAPSIFDRLEERGVRYATTDWRVPDEDRLADARTRALAGDLDAVFLYLTGLDGAQHDAGVLSDKSRSVIAGYESYFEHFLKELREKYEPVRLSVFSDHGMTDVVRCVDLMAWMRGEAGLREGRDYLAFYDSTIARFWPRDAGIRHVIEGRLDAFGEGTRLGPDELSRWGVHFPDGRYGEIFYLLPHGTLLLPSHMGDRPLRGMHGYTPEDPRSDAVLLRSHPVAEDVRHIADVRRVLEAEILP